MQKRVTLPLFRKMELLAKEFAISARNYYAMSPYAVYIRAGTHSINFATRIFTNA